MSSQPEEGEILKASIPSAQEEPASPSVPKKYKITKIWIKKRKRISRRLVPNPSIVKTILEEDEDEEETKLEEEEEQMPLYGIT